MRLSRVLEAVAEKGLCQSCQESSPRTLHYCVGCRLLVCKPCAGVAIPQIIPLVVCAFCRAQSLLERGEAFAEPEREVLRRQEALVLAASSCYLESRVTRSSTKGNHLTGVRAYQKFAERMGMTPFPAMPMDVVHFISHIVITLQLSGSTAASYVDGVADLHERLVELKLLAVNPCLDATVLQTARKTFTRPSMAKVPLSFPLLKSMVRKCISQRLFDDGWPEDVRDDMGAWVSEKRKKSTRDHYETTPLRIRLLALIELGKGKGSTYYAKTD